MLLMERWHGTMGAIPTDHDHEISTNHAIGPSS